MYIEGLCHGNLSEEEAINISNIFTNTFPVEPIPAGLRHKERVICLSSGCSLNRSVSVKNELEVNSVVEVYISIVWLCAICCLQVGRTFRFWAATSSSNLWDQYGINKILKKLNTKWYWTIWSKTSIWNCWH